MTLDTKERYQAVSVKSSRFVNFHSKATSKWQTDLQRTSYMTSPFLLFNDFAYRPQIRTLNPGSFPLLSLRETLDEPDHMTTKNLGGKKK